MVNRLGKGIAFTLLCSASVAWPNETSKVALEGLSLEQLLNIPIQTRLFTESINNAPRPLSIYTQASLRDNLVDSVFDLSLLVPNFSYRRNFGRYQERPVIRGVSTLIGEPPVGMMVDGVSVSHVSTTLPMVGLERIEVLRGPEAALYGRANFAGAVNFIYKRPSQLNGFNLEARSGENGYQQASLDGNLVVSNDLSVMANGVAYSRGNQIENQLGDVGKGYGQERTGMLSVAASWQPSNALDIYYRASSQTDKDGHVPTYLQSSESNNCFLETTQQYFCGEVTAPTQQGYNSKLSPWAQTFHSQASRHHLEVGLSDKQYDIKLTAARSVVDNKTGFDSDLYELDRSYGQLVKESSDTTLQAISNFYFDKSRLLLGVSQFSQAKRSQSHNAFNLGESVSLSSGPSVDVGVRNVSVFASFDTRLATGIELNLDLRYAKDSIDYRTENKDSGGVYAGENSWTSWSPRVNLSKQINDDWLAYVSIAKGRKPGGFNDNLEALPYENAEERARVLGFLTYEEEVLVSYETGLKGSLVEDKLFFHWAMFYYDWEDLQLTQSLGYTNQESNTVRVASTINGGTSRNLGFEAEFEAVLHPQLSARLNVGYTQTQLNNTETTAQFDLTGDADVSGKQIPNAPILDAYSGLYYKRTLANRIRLKSSTTLGYESKRYVAEHNLAHIGDFYRVNFMIGLERDYWSIALWGKNLNRDRTPESVARFGDAASFFRTRAFGISLAEERQVAFELSVHY